MYSIYALYDLLHNRRFYIGFTEDIEKREEQHKNCIEDLINGRKSEFTYQAHYYGKEIGSENVKLIVLEDNVSEENKYRAENYYIMCEKLHNKYLQNVRLPCKLELIEKYFPFDLTDVDFPFKAVLATTRNRIIKNEPYNEYLK